MSDVMLLGILSMPYEMAMQDELSRMQFYGRAQEAVARILSDAVLIDSLKGQIVNNGINEQDLKLVNPIWHPIETAPKDGKCLVAINTDDGYVIAQLDRNKRGDWIHEGEPTYCKSYYFEPTHWTQLPPPPPPEETL